MTRGTIHEIQHVNHRLYLIIAPLDEEAALIPHEVTAEDVAALTAACPDGTLLGHFVELSDEDGDGPDAVTVETLEWADGVTQ